MRIPLSWLKEFVTLPKDIKHLTDKLSMAGHMLDKIDRIGKETVIDVELRGNRADCYSIIGIAREVSALFHTPLKLPPLYKKIKLSPSFKESRLEIKTPLVKRAMMAIIKNVVILPSPSWMKQRLEVYGIPAINNIVDATNYVMLETGEPMHAFDLDKVKPDIQIRMAKKGEKMVTFAGETVSLTGDDLVWAKGSQVISVAGAIGSLTHSISQSTKNILIEAANYDQASIRRTIHRHNLMTEAGLRHEKKLDPNMVSEAIGRFLQLVKENNWGEISPGAYDYYPQRRKPQTIFLSISAVEEIGGLKIPKKRAVEILQSLQCSIKRETKQGFLVSCPTYRTDLTEEADLIEEIIRMEGYDKIPPKTLALEIPSPTTPASIYQEEKIRQALVSLNFSEVINLPFVKEKNRFLNQSLEEVVGAQPVYLTNPPSPDFHEMTMSLLPRLWESAQRIRQERVEEVQCFELGKIYYRIKKDLNYASFREKRKLGLIYGRKEKTDYRLFKGYIEALFKLLNISAIEFREHHLPLPFIYAFKIVLGTGEAAGVGGALENYLYYFQADLETLIGKEEPPKSSLWPKYPPIIEDISLVISPNTLLGPLVKSIYQTSPLISSVELVDLYQNIRTFRITYRREEGSLTDEEIKPVRQQILDRLEKKFQARLKE